MYKKNLVRGLIGAVILLGATTAHSASLSIVGGSAVNLNANFSLTAQTGLASGTSVQKFDSGSDGSGTGLFLAGAPTAVTFEYLGSEAANHNRAIEYEGPDTNLFKNWGGGESSVGDSSTINFVNNGALKFLFKSGSKKARNAGGIANGLTIALFQESATSIIALFGDGAGDQDYDDMAMRISVTAVPLPPSLLLFGGAMIGLGFLARRRKKSASAA